MSHPNPELQLARSFVEQTDCSLFLTGKAGTGKTTFLHRIKEQSHKRLVVTAPTGVAAINAGGVTLHSFFQLPFGPFLPGSEVHTGQHRMSREKRDLINSLDLLVIDEISMVRADLLDGVDAVLRRYRRSELPFGGVQLLMIGDLHQLPPVVKEAEWQLLAGRYASPFFFSSMALSGVELIPIELKHIYRQSDGRFIDLLNRVRDNRLDPPSLALLNSRHQPDLVPDEGSITLCTHNHRADAINRARLDRLPGTVRCFEAGVEGTFPDYAFPTAASLELKVGAQVMFVRNDLSPDKRYFNGKIGTIVALGREKIRVDCPGDAEPIEVGPVTWENIEYRVDAETAEISPKVVGSFNQVPLKPAWAITIHKSQGLTFDRAMIDAQDAFAPGQVYVALSRCRTLEGLTLSRPITASAIKTDPAVLGFVAGIEQRTPTEATLRAATIRYQQRLLHQCYDFQTLDRLLGRLVGLIGGNASIVEVHGTADLYEVQRSTRETICTVGDNFKRQLQALFGADREPAADPTIRERLAKAAVYFRQQFETVLMPCLDNLGVESDNKEVRKRIHEALKQVRREAAIKQAAVRACDDGFSPARYLRALSLAALEGERRPAKTESVYTEADVGHPDLFRALRQWRTDRAGDEGVAPYMVLRQKPLMQIAVHLPDSIDGLLAIKGIGKRLAARYGAEIVALVADFRRKEGIETVALPSPAAGSAKVGPTGTGKREDTKATSLAMLREGLTIAEIADRRVLTKQTVEGHLAFYVKSGELAIDNLLPEERRRALEEKIAALADLSSLKALKTALGDEYSYGEINLVLAHLHHRQDA